VKGDAVAKALQVRKVRQARKDQVVLFIVPFSTGYTAIATPTTNATGQSLRIAVTGFGESGLNIVLDAPNGDTFSPAIADDFYMFTLAADIILTKIRASVVNGAFIDLTAFNDLVPYIVIATAPPDSKNFTFVPETYFDTAPYVGGQSYAICINLYLDSYYKDYF
jgi:hypothetical protein